MVNSKKYEILIRCSKIKCSKEDNNVQLKKGCCCLVVHWRCFNCVGSLKVLNNVTLWAPNLIFAVDHHLCDVWKQKTQILIAHQKEGIEQTQKSTAIRQKQFPKGLEDFAHNFCCWPPPMWCLKAKISNSYCSSEGKYRVNPKKYGYLAKTVLLGFRGFRPYFLLLTTPYVMF